MLTQERLKELFVYSEGALIRRVPRSNSKAGDVVGCLSPIGYLVTSVDGVLYYNHQLVFIYHHGYKPENEIDHIDRDKLNNRIENLREVSRSCNNKNREARTSSKSGVTGVSWDSTASKWKAEISLGVRNVNLGRFQDLTEAVAHRLAAEQSEDWEGCHSSTSAYLHMNEYLRRKK